MNNNFELMIAELDNARIRRTPNSQCSVYDLIAVVGDKKNPRQVWNDLQKVYPEVVQKTDNFKFIGKGQRKTPVTDREGWAYILGLLPGIMGHRYREEAAKLLIRYLDADITLSAEIVDRNENEDDLIWLEARLRGKITRKRVCATYARHGVYGKGYARCTNETYLGLYGATAKGMRRRKGLPENANWRDFASINELNEISFTEDLENLGLKRINANGNDECANECFNISKKVAQLKLDIAGV
jgi:hypothetical protein